MTFRLYISKEIGWKKLIFEKFEEKNPQVFEKITQHAKS